MLKRTLFFCSIITFFIAKLSFGQCPTSYFSLPASACINEQIFPENSSTGAISYVWDFCSGDFELTPTIESIGSSKFIGRGRSFRIVETDEGNWIGFSIDQAGNRLVRFEFGSSPQNKPSITNLGNPSSALSGAFDFNIVQASGQWYILVVNSLTNEFIRISFGYDLLNISPAVDNLGSFGELNKPNSLTTVIEADNVFTFISNGGNGSITRLEFGNSIENSPAATSFIVTGIKNPRGIDIIKDCDRWVGLVTSYSNNKLFYLDFQDGLSQKPITDIISFFASFNFPAGLSIIHEGGQYYSLIQSALGDLYKLSFGASISDFTGNGQNLGNFGLKANFANEWINSGSDWYGFSIELSNPSTPGAGNLIRFTFPTICYNTKVTSNLKNPESKYTSSGTYQISLESSDVNGNVNTFNKSITISSSEAPQIDAQITGNCISSPINFSGQELSGTINSWKWDFGDGSGTSILQSDSYAYSKSGTYPVKLNVKDANGCSNVIMDTVRIYEEPISNFSYPGNLCTNNPVLFTNTSTGETGPVVTWVWDFNGEGSSTDKESIFSFAEGGDKNITLSTSIPGCSSEISKIINIIPGPITNFIFNGNCEYDQFEFTNNTTGDDITGYQWNFGDGYFSSKSSPRHRFEACGNYVVGLTASNALGCSTKLKKVVPVRYIPELNFTNDLACSENTVTFFDQSSVQGANIVERNWILKNNSLGYEQYSQGLSPSFLLEGAGEYEVTQIDFSNYGCMDTLVRNINVYKSPVADFIIENTCLGDSTLLSPAVQLPEGTTLTSVDWLIDGGIYSEDVVKHKFKDPGNFDIELYIRASNLCSGNISKILAINPLPEVDFLMSSFCKDQLVDLKSTTTSSFDPVKSYTWSIDDHPVSWQDQFQYEFKKADRYNVTLGVITKNNCPASKDKTIEINPSPRSEFDAFPSYGASPLKVSFIDRSKGAQTVQYLFSKYNKDGTNEANPIYIYNNIGKDLSTQIVENEFGCTDTSSLEIDVVIPVYNISISEVKVDVIDGQLKFIIGIQNNGTIILNNPHVKIDLGHEISVNHTIKTSLLPGASNEYEINFEVLKRSNQSIDYICFSFSGKLGAFLDVEPFDNEQCINIDRSFNVLEPFPNPSSTHVDVPVILPSSGNLDLQMTSENGSIVYHKRFQNLSPGLNVISIDLTPYRSGFYLLTVRHTDFETTTKLVIQ